MSSIITEEMLKESTFVRFLKQRAATELHRVLLRQGTIKFGAPGPGIEEQLKSINDLEHLERLGDAIVTVSSWNDVLATP